MELTIKILKADVMAEVDKTSAYVGAKTITQDGGNLYYNISTIKEDAEMLERYWREACSDVAAVAKEFLKSAETTDEDWTLTLGMPAKYNTGFNEVLKNRVFSYIVRAILIRWLLLCGFSANMIKTFQEEAHGILIGIEDILYARDFTRAAEGVVGNNNFGGYMRQGFGEAKVVVISHTRPTPTPTDTHPNPPEGRELG